MYVSPTSCLSSAACSSDIAFHALPHSQPDRKTSFNWSKSPKPTNAIGANGSVRLSLNALSPARGRESSLRCRGTKRRFTRGRLSTKALRGEADTDSGGYHRVRREDRRDAIEGDEMGVNQCRGFGTGRNGRLTCIASSSTLILARITFRTHLLVFFTHSPHSSPTSTTH